MLGDLVEYDFSIKEGDRIALGQEIGSMEGFKAVASIYSVAEGEFSGAGEELSSDITLLESDPYGRGWLYRVRGSPDPQGMDVHGYAALLDGTIDRLLKSRHDKRDTDDEG
jgi:glycine cleavage system H protein